jgi:hypothetical protein
MSTLAQVREAKRRMDDADENLRAFLERTKTQPPDRARHTELVNAAYETARDYQRVVADLELPTSPPIWLTKYIITHEGDGPSRRQTQTYRAVVA